MPTPSSGEACGGKSRARAHCVSDWLHGGGGRTDGGFLKRESEMLQQWIKSSSGSCIKRTQLRAQRTRPQQRPRTTHPDWTGCEARAHTGTQARNTGTQARAHRDTGARTEGHGHTHTHAGRDTGARTEGHGHTHAHRARAALYRAPPPGGKQFATRQAQHQSPKPWGASVSAEHPCRPRVAAPQQAQTPSRHAHERERTGGQNDVLRDGRAPGSEAVKARRGAGTEAAPRHWAA